jgi:hypothetical protein
VDSGAGALRLEDSALHDGVFSNGKQLAVATLAPAGAARDKSDCCFRKTATEYDRKPGMKWLSYTAK